MANQQALIEAMRLARAEWRTKMAVAVVGIASFGLGLEHELGTISLDEAVDALKKEAGELIEGLRR